MDSPCSFVRPSAVSVRMITWILSSDCNLFLHMFHFSEDLGWDRIWASCLIKYAHNGWSCDLGIFGIPKVNFPARAFKLDIYRDLVGTHDIIFVSFYNICIFPEFFTYFLMNLGARSWVLGVRTMTWIVFIGFQFFVVYVSLGSRS